MHASFLEDCIQEFTNCIPLKMDQECHQLCFKTINCHQAP